MTIYFRNIFPINNLRTDPQKSASRKGQVATLLILFMVVVLVFILVTVNVGQVSLTATRLANAADAGALYLASQLSTRSYTLNEALKTAGGDYSTNPPKACKKTGLLSTILAIIFAIIVTIATLGAGWEAGAVIIAAGVAGAVGGAIGGAIAGTGVLQGAIMGFTIGASIGFGITAGASSGAGMGTNVASLLGLSEEAVKAMVTTFQIAGALSGAGFSVASSVYNQYIVDQMTGGAFAEAAEKLSELPDEHRYRESVFLQVLAQSIDDPTKVQDTDDSDDDGNTTEMVPYFQYWWDVRVKQLRSQASDFPPLVQDFIDGPVTDLQDFINSEAFAMLSKQEVEGTDSELLYLVRTLEEDFNYEISFWESGVPTPEEPVDEIDFIKLELQDLKDALDELKQKPLNELVDTWKTWLPTFYSVYYTPINTWINGDEALELQGLNAWKSQIEEIRDGLPECQVQVDPTCAAACETACAADPDPEACLEVCLQDCGVAGYVAPLPCQSSVDEDLTDEFSMAITAIDDIISALVDFRNNLFYFYNNMKNVDANIKADYVTYEWLDMRGKHSVTVEVGDYNIAWLKDTKSGNWLKGKKCLELRDYSDGGKCWVKVTRRDPANQDLGLLGVWNLSASDEMVTTRTSKAGYSYNYVKISGIQN